MSTADPDEPREAPEGGVPSSEGVFRAITRRRWLKWALGGGVVLAGGGAGLWALRGSAAHVSGLAVLSDQEYRTLMAVAETHLPHGGPFATGAVDVDLGKVMDAFLEGQTATGLRDLKRALVLFEYGPLLFGHRLATFSNLSAAERLVEWRRWTNSDRLLQRQVALGFRKLMGMVFYDRPEVWPHIGYPGPSLWGMPK